MKLEKISDNQIRCTLSKEDLTQRQIHLSELAYGSEKAKELFRDMMQQASIELGFEADNIPLMIEAIPISSDCLVLLVTKVEDPDELDTRFSRFSKINMDDSFDEDFSDIDDNDFEEIDFLDDEDDDMVDEPLPFTPTAELENSDSSDSAKERSAIDEALDLIAPFTQAIAQAKKEALKKKKESTSPTQDCQYYSFRNFTQAAQLGSFLSPFFNGESSLYKDTVSNNYYMILRRADSETDTFHRACNIAADFGVRISASYATPAYFKEHFQTILSENAIEMLCELA